ncbi:hypothetical protein R1flu_016334 [Riccia fluitans]|uniref:RNA helicase n=1 Tax=Riccia fluitans TaxID=41844 RepID=A0ABD1YLR7_9MARC
MKGAKESGGRNFAGVSCRRPHFGIWDGGAPLLMVMAGTVVRGAAKRRRKDLALAVNRAPGETVDSTAVSPKAQKQGKRNKKKRKRKDNNGEEDAEQKVDEVHESEAFREFGHEGQGKTNRKKKKGKKNRISDDAQQPDGGESVTHMEQIVESAGGRQSKKNRKKLKKGGNKAEENKDNAEDRQHGQGFENERESGDMDLDIQCAEATRKDILEKKNKRKNKGEKAAEDRVNVENGPEQVTELNDHMVANSVGPLSKTKEKSQRDIVLVESEFRDVKEPALAADMGGVSAKKRLSYVVHVKRPEEVEKGRENLPIVMMEQEIMEAIHENAAVIVCGETGCGKTTQVPQFLYEAGYGSGRNNERGGMIGVTQPRRVAVLGTARRVAHELNVNLGQEVGFQVRHDRKLGEKCSIKFMTDGILLRELQGDFLLRKYSAIVLDEAHERSLNTDILIGMLSRIVPLRQKLYDQQANARKKVDNGHEARDPDLVTPLKLVIMSATLRVEDFTANARMFPTPPPVIRVPARQFPVSVHFSKKTELMDYVGAAYKKVCAIHRKLPPGGVLVFVTGQREVEDLCKKLRKAFQPRRNKNAGGTSGKLTDLKDVVDGEDEFGGLNMDKISAAVDEDEAANGSHMDEKNEEYDVTGDQVFENLSESEDDSDLEVSDDEGFREEDVLERLRRTLYPTDSKPGYGSLVHEEKEPVLPAKESSSLTKEDTNSPREVLTNQKVLESHAVDHEDPTKQKTDTDSKSSKTFGLKDLGKADTEPISTRKNDKTTEPGPLHVLPLYAMLPAAAQLKVFGDMPKGKRFVVVATNVAETSITIPGVRYVVDCGRAKEKEFDRSSGISKFEIQWISKASADQRAGRAGRTGPGHCYRLYSSAHFNHSFPTFGRPEIHKSPIEGVVLVMKCMGIDKVSNFPFPTPPDRTAVIEAEKCLKSLSALNSQTGLLTTVGQGMAVYPISPRHSRMLLAAIQEAKELSVKIGEADVSLAMAYAIAVASVLSLDDPFLREAGITEEEEVQATEAVQEGIRHKSAFDAGDEANGEADIFNSNSEQQEDWMVAEKAKRKARRAKAGAAHLKFRNVSSDALSVANALRAYDQALNPEEFCQINYLHSRTMSEMSKLRIQLKDLIVSNISESKRKLGTVEATKGADSSWSGDLIAKSELCWREPYEKKLSQLQEALIRRAICAGWADKVSRKLSLQERAAIPDAQRKRKVVAYRSCSTEEPIFLHPTSVVSKEAPEFVVYNELVHTSRIHMQRVTSVESSWLVRQAEAMCTYSKPLTDPPPWYDPLADEVMCWVTPSFGPHLWELPLHRVVLKRGKHRTAVFACALLQGKVLPSLSLLKPCLTNDPNIILKPESQALKRVSDLMYRLTLAAADTRAKLRDCWAKDAHFLYLEIMSWVQGDVGDTYLLCSFELPGPAPALEYKFSRRF